MCCGGCFGVVMSRCQAGELAALLACVRVVVLLYQAVVCMA